MTALAHKVWPAPLTTPLLSTPPPFLIVSLFSPTLPHKSPNSTILTMPNKAQYESSAQIATLCRAPLSSTCHHPPSTFQSSTPPSPVLPRATCPLQANIFQPPAPLHPHQYLRQTSPMRYFGPPHVGRQTLTCQTA